MTLIEIRKWQIEKAFEVAARMADAQRQAAERLFLASVALAAATPVYLTLMRTSPMSYTAMTIWIPLFLAFVGSIFMHVNSSDMQREASRKIGKRAQRIGRDDIDVDFKFKSLRSFQNARTFMMFTVVYLGIGFAFAIAYAADRTLDCVRAGEPTSAACAF